MGKIYVITKGQYHELVGATTDEKNAKRIAEKYHASIEIIHDLEYHAETLYKVIFGHKGEIVQVAPIEADDYHTYKFRDKANIYPSGKGYDCYVYVCAECVNDAMIKATNIFHRDVIQCAHCTRFVSQDGCNGVCTKIKRHIPKLGTQFCGHGIRKEDV